jgi:hypothetical protein
MSHNIHISLEVYLFFKIESNAFSVGRDFQWHEIP